MKDDVTMNINNVFDNYILKEDELLKYGFK